MSAAIFARRGLTAAAVATVALGATVVPATAAPQAATPVAAISGHGSTVGLGADVQITRGDIMHAQPVGKWVVVPAGRPVDLALRFQLGGVKSVYSDVHFRTSNPGTAMGCRMDHIYADVADHGFMDCGVTLPAMKPGTTAKYWVTMTGKRDGKAFSVTRSTTVLAPKVQVSIYVDGVNATGRTVRVPARGTSRITYVVTNRSSSTISGLYDFVDEPSRCKIAPIAAGKTGKCTFNMDRKWFAGQKYQMWDLQGRFASTWGSFGTAPLTYVAGR